MKMSQSQVGQKRKQPGKRPSTFAHVTARATLTRQTRGGCHCDTGATSGKRPKPIFFSWNRCQMGQPDVFRLHIFRFGHFGVPRGPPRDSEKSSKSSVKFWREDVGHLIIRPDILNIRPDLFHILESAQPRFITHFRRSKRKVTVLPPQWAGGGA